MAKTMIIGRAERGDIKINLDRLIESRLLVQANSGGGKSWAIRRILEQTHGKVQQIVIDVEDEFHTLREKFDYILAGSTAGDCPADVRTAPILARRLLELNTSAIIGIYELKAHDRIRFVRQFLDSLVNAPRELWHPVLVVVDEAHVFCPQHGEAESAGAVIDLMTRGRKRGFCGILATQRISKLHKDAAAEANNKLIGRSALDVDMKRAADELGFSGRDQQLTLRTLKPGEFYAFGPAVSDVITQLRVGDIETSHPRAGHRAATPPPPKAAILKVLDQLKDLPREAQEELKTTESLRARVRELEFMVKKASSQMTVQVEKKEMERAVKETAAHITENFKGRFTSIRTGLEGMIKILNQSVAEISPSVTKVHQTAPKLPPMLISKEYLADDVMPPGHIRKKIEAAINGTMGKAERLILTVLSQYPQGRSKVQVALMAGYAHSGGSFSNAISALRSSGNIEGGNEHLRITAAGSATVGAVDPLPRGVDLLRQWQRQVGKAEREILDVLFEVYPQPLSKSDIADRTASKYQAEGGSFNNSICRLRTLELIKGRREMVLSEELVG